MYKENHTIHKISGSRNSLLIIVTKCQNQNCYVMYKVIHAINVS